MIRPSIVFAAAVLVATTGCIPRYAHLVPGTDMAYPHSRLDPLLESLIPACLETSPTDRAGRTQLQARQCAPIRADSVRDPLALGQPKTSRP
jgi:hypothetical protein